MIIVKIKAGLGNQMFQYALGKRLEFDWRDELKFDLSWFSNVQKGETPRDLEIDMFKVSLPNATEIEISQVRGGVVMRTVIKIKDLILGRLDRNYFFSFHSSLLRKKKQSYLDGYFQSYRYFETIREKLLNDFVLKDGYSNLAQKFKKDIEQEGQTVAIHVRRGDYVTTCKNWNGLCDVTYYKKGIEEIEKKQKNIRLYVFSDDINWAKKNLEFGRPTIFVSHPDLNSAEEILLMSLCQHQIIANSSFSWWSAWLNKNTQKIVVAPSRWLLSADINTCDLLPEKWIRIEKK